MIGWGEWVVLVVVLLGIALVQGVKGRSDGQE